MGQIVTQPILGTPLNGDHPLSVGLIGCWSFNEGGGQLAFDKTGYVSKPGALTNGAIFKQSQRGNVVFFDGTDDKILTDNINSWDLSTTKNFSCAIWIRPAFANSSNTGSAVFNFGDTLFPFKRTYLRWESASLGFYLDISDSQVGGSAWNMGASNPAFSADTWHHIAFTHTYANAAQFYWDGLSITTTIQATTAEINITNFPLNIGFGPVNSYKWSGLIGHILFYNRVLSATDIRQLYVNSYQMFSNYAACVKQQSQLFHLNFNNPGIRPRPFAPGLAR